MSSTSKIIGICGYPCHGKSTAQDFLVMLGVEARDDAASLRERVMNEYGLTIEEVTTQEGKLKIVEGIDGQSMTVRQLLGDYGQIHGEVPYGPNYWVEQAIMKLREQGVRHPVSFGSIRRSQASAVRAVGGFVIAIQDPRKKMSEHYFDEYDYDHVDCMVMNDGSVEDLRFAVFLAVADYLRPSIDQIKTAAGHF